MTAIASALESLLDTSRILAFEQLELSLQRRFQQAWQPGSALPIAVYPETQDELSEVMKLANANQWKVLPWGAGSKIDWGGVAASVDLLVSTQRMNRVIEHAVGDLTLTVEAGMSLQAAERLLAPHQQFLAFDPAYATQATLGGIIATADTGSWRHRYGGVRDRLIGVSFVRSDGELAKAGGRVVKNVAGYDLMKLLTGSYGTLGIVCQVTLRLYPIPESSATVLLSGMAAPIAQATQTVLNSSLNPTVVDLRPNSDRQMTLAIRFQSIPQSVAEQCQRVLDVGQELGLTSQVYQEQDETQLWQTWRDRIELRDPDAVVCKIGVRPTEAVSFLQTLQQLTSSDCEGAIHARMGLGLLRINGIRSTQLLEMRSHLHQKGGFLTILEAPLPLKQSVEVWGYDGNGLNIMHRLKQQFDPNGLLSPKHFLAKR